MKPVQEILIEQTITDSFFIDRLENRVVNTDFPNRLSYHRIIFVEGGTGRLTVDDSFFEVKNSEVFLLSKGQIYQFETPSVVSGYIVSFGDCFWEKTPRSASNCKAVLFNNTIANQRLLPNDSEMNELSLLFTTLLNEYEMPAYTNQQDAMAAYLKIIMIKLANVKMTNEDTFDSQDYLLYRKFMDLLSAQYQNYHAVSDYAKMLNITARRLSDLCKRCSKKNAKEMINGQIIAEAKRSLQFSSSPVKEIACQLNFNTPEQFSHFFKKNTNISPADYRNQFISIGL
ncbi:hypothetical protein DBR11_07925 [Pedobacter sp. HMWF019]|uniref:helix-turn-helix domain-containing protein n=1 Tax=Pedobacter sp. HMWF019 TaxID=2056856 RepID=UPI000D3567C1|nr:helix-turn-helix domain-containing protein [Pedobacter sp. HMWF019]PTT01247.1 hypothetical protein DBR11_07925 [Pedobacter sp. HMWF019]